MLRLGPSRKPFLEAGALHKQINLFGFWDEHTFLTKAGDPGVVLKVDGIDYESLDSVARDSAVMATNTPRDNVERQRYVERFGVREGLLQLAQDHPVTSRML